MCRSRENIVEKIVPPLVEPTNSIFAFDSDPAAHVALVMRKCSRRVTDPSPVGGVRSKNMPVVRLLACVSAIFFMAQTPAAAGSPPTPKNAAQPSYMRVHGQALPPFGFVHFCRRHREDCDRGAGAQYARFNATPSHLSELDAVNRAINFQIKPVTDLELYGREEYWTYPTGSGDCEDYVVLKRKILMQRGWPASALLITVVRDEVGDGHAVLTVRTRQGDFILDNKVDDVRVWSRTPYKYLMRQSYLNPKLWMALDPRAKTEMESVAGVNSTD